MNRKMTQMLQPSFQLYFVCLILFAAASAFFSLYLAAAEAVGVVLLGLYYRENSRRRRREIAKYIENVTGNMDVATKDTMVNSPLPMVIFRPESDDIIWTNDRFLHLAGEKEHLFDAKLSSVIPDFDTRWLMEGKNECPTEVTFGPRRFLVYGHLVRASGREGGFLATTYWVDVTEFCQVRDQFRGSRPVMAVLLLDNSAADVMRETYADMLVAIDDFDTAMLKPGLVAHVQGRRVLALDGFEAALTDKAAKQRMWAYIKQLTPAAAPL